MKNIISFFNKIDDDFFVSKKGKKSTLGVIIAFCLLFSVNLKEYLQLYNNIAAIILCILISIVEVSLLIVSCLSFPMLISSISYCINQKVNIENLFFVINSLINFFASIRILVFLLFKI